jgi:hypothetical protein
MEYEESLKLYQELLESSKDDEQSIIHAHILKNMNDKLIEKLDLLQSEIANSSHVMNESLINLYSHVNTSHIHNYIILDRIDKKLYWVYFIWYTLGIAGTISIILRLCGVIND